MARRRGGAVGSARRPPSPSDALQAQQTRMGWSPDRRGAVRQQLGFRRTCATGPHSGRNARMSTARRKPARAAMSRRGHRNRGLSPSARGHDAKFRALRKKLAPAVATGRIGCWRCGRCPIVGPWDLGHDDYDRSVVRGPECRSCSRSAAAQKRAQMYGPFRGRRTPAASRRTPTALRFFD